MKVFLFQPQFHQLILSGQKRQTIRATRKRPVRVGDELSLRYWTGKPYRSPQAILKEGVRCTRTGIVELIPRSSADGMFISCFLNGDRLTAEVGRHGEWDNLAIADGFKNAAEMLEWFKQNHGLPFKGDLVCW